jgi:hypothetical protein
LHALHFGLRPPGRDPLLSRNAGSLRTLGRDCTRIHTSRI